jgi:hypothetical protein
MLNLPSCRTMCSTAIWCFIRYQWTAIVCAYVCVYKREREREGEREGEGEKETGRTRLPAMLDG